MDKSFHPEFMGFVDDGAQLFKLFKTKAQENKNNGRLTIRDVLEEGQELTVQIEKEERGN